MSSGLKGRSGQPGPTARVTWHATTTDPERVVQPARVNGPFRADGPRWPVSPGRWPGLAEPALRAGKSLGPLAFALLERVGLDDREDHRGELVLSGHRLLHHLVHGA